MAYISHNIGNIFTQVPEGYVLGHCIAADAVMGKGIAPLFVERYPHIATLRNMVPLKVGAAYYIDPVINLVTKQRSGGKPTYDAMHSALCSMRDILVTRGIKYLALPHIGCGLDRLSWSIVLSQIIEVLNDTAVTVRIYKL